MTQGAWPAVDECFPSTRSASPNTRRVMPVGRVKGAEDPCPAGRAPPWTGRPTTRAAPPWTCCPRSCCATCSAQARCRAAAGSTPTPGPGAAVQTTSWAQVGGTAEAEGGRGRGMSRHSMPPSGVLRYGTPYWLCHDVPPAMPRHEAGSSEEDHEGESPQPPRASGPWPPDPPSCPTPDLSSPPLGPSLAHPASSLARRSLGLPT